MSKIFYDHLVEIEEFEDIIKEIAESSEERHELWHIVDEIIHHRVLGCVFDHLPHEHHEMFLEKFHEAPYDDGLIEYINDLIDIEKNIENLIANEVAKLKRELFEDLVLGG